MIIKLTYIVLLLLMLFVLYHSGIRLQKEYKIWSGAGLLAILVYTLNEGLRFGRGIDYNNAGIGYERYASYSNATIDNYVGYELLVRTLVNLDVPWQGAVMLMSFLFIVGLLYLMRSLKEVVPFALPLFVLVSSGTVENLLKWYLAFSFFMIGLSYQITNLDKLNKKFVIFSCVGILFHIAFAPIPIIFYLLIKLKKPLLPPFWSILLFFAIAFLFQASFMLNFVELVNAAAFFSDRFEHYSEDVEMWLTQGFSGRTTVALPGYSETLFLMVVTLFGYKSVKLMGQKYIYIYNLFLIGFLLKPIANLIPILLRLDYVFFFFRAVVFACILQVIYKEKKVFLRPLFLHAVLLIFFIWTFSFVKAPITGIPERFLYVWNKGNLSYEDMLVIHSEQLDKTSESRKQKNNDNNLFNLFNE